MGLWRSWVSGNYMVSGKAATHISVLSAPDTFVSVNSCTIDPTCTEGILCQLSGLQTFAQFDLLDEDKMTNEGLIDAVCLMDDHGGY